MNMHDIHGASVDDLGGDFVDHHYKAMPPVRLLVWVGARGVQPPNLRMLEHVDSEMIFHPILVQSMPGFVQ